MIAWLSQVILPSAHSFSKSVFKQLTSIRTEALSRLAIHVDTVSLRQTHPIMGFFGLRWPRMIAVNRIFEAKLLAMRKIHAARTGLPKKPQLNQACTISIFRR